MNGESLIPSRRGVIPGAQSLLAHACRPAVGKYPGADFASSPQVLLCGRALHTSHLHRAATWDGGPLCTLGRWATTHGEAGAPVKPLNWITLALGGQVQDLAASWACLRAERHFLHEHRRRPPLSAPASPRVLGIDERAWKKGHRYRTMLCDLEQGRVIDRLPTRDAETVAAWLHQHPSCRLSD
jgi:hypothetical protein